MRTRVNVPIMMASLFLSIMLWFVAYTSNLPAPDTIAVPVVAQGLDPDRLFLARLENTMRVKVQAPEEKLRDLHDARPTAYVDLTGAKAGQSYYPVQFLPADMNKYLVDPAPQVRVSLEEMDSKKVPVVVEGTGRISDPNFTVTKQQPSQARATVTGPKNEVDTVTRVRAIFDLGDVDPNDPQAQSQTLVPQDVKGVQPQHVRVSPSQVLVKPTVTVAAAERTVVVSPQIIGQPAPGYLSSDYRCEPSTISIVGKSLTIAAISKVLTEPIDITGLREDRIFRVGLRLPSGTSTRGRSTVTVNVLVRPAPTLGPIRPGGVADTTGGEPAP